MSDVRGVISIDVKFTDSTTSSGVSSLKTISLRDATEYSSGKVAIVTGTVGTAAITVDPAPSAYRNASGEIVSFASISKVAFQSSRGVSVSNDGSPITLSLGGVAVACANLPSPEPFVLQPQYTVGTASYTLVLYGT